MNHRAKAIARSGASRVALGAAVLTAVLASERASFGSVEDPIDGTRALIERWVTTRTLISAERRDWAEGKELLGARIELVKSEIEALRAKEAEAAGSVGDTDRKRDELTAERDALVAATASLDAVIGELERRTLALLPRVPAPLRESVKTLSQRIPTDPAATKATLGERFQNVVYVLNALDKFNRDVTVALEVRDLPDGGAMEVSTLYLGVGCAFYASANGAAAGFGTPTADGWAWTPSNDLAPAVLAALAVNANQTPAAFVRLPLRVD